MFLLVSNFWRKYDKQSKGLDEAALKYFTGVRTNGMVYCEKGIHPAEDGGPQQSVFRCI